MDISELHTIYLTIVQIDDQMFLADGQGATIHHLNPIGTTIWSLLAEPMTADEMTNLLMAAFPDHARSSIESDLGSLIDELLNRNLLLAGSSRPEQHLKPVRPPIIVNPANLPHLTKVKLCFLLWE
jgi:hypothetical protein